MFGFRQVVVHGADWVRLMQFLSLQRSLVVQTAPPNGHDQFIEENSGPFRLSKPSNVINAAGES